MLLTTYCQAWNVSYSYINNKENTGKTWDKVWENLILVWLLQIAVTSPIVRFGLGMQMRHDWNKTFTITFFEYLCDTNKYIVPSCTILYHFVSCIGFQVTAKRYKHYAARKRKQYLTCNVNAKKVTATKENRDIPNISWEHIYCILKFERKYEIYGYIKETLFL